MEHAQNDSHSETEHDYTPREEPFSYSNWEIPADEYIGPDEDPTRFVADRKINDWSSPVLVKVYQNDHHLTETELMNLATLSPEHDRMKQWLKAHPLAGYVLVTNLQLPHWHAKWKFPAGHRKKESDDGVGWRFDRTPFETAVHEACSETGLDDIYPAGFTFVGGYLHPIKRDHWRFYYVAHIASCQLSGLNPYHPENEGVTPKLFTVSQFDVLAARKRIVDPHLDALTRFPMLP